MSNPEKTANSGTTSESARVSVKITLMALFAALIAAGTFIAIPIGPIPIVLQNFFALLSGLVLGPFLGAAAAGLYLLAGILSLPVFAGLSGGIARFAGPRRISYRVFARGALRRIHSRKAPYTEQSSPAAPHHRGSCRTSHCLCSRSCMA